MKAFIKSVLFIWKMIVMSAQLNGDWVTMSTLTALTGKWKLIYLYPTEITAQFNGKLKLRSAN